MIFGGCRISWLFSLPSSALAGLFSFDACKVFLAGILPRDPVGAPAPGPATVRYHTYTASLFCLPQVFSYVYLVVSPFFPPVLLPLSTCSRRYSLLFSQLHTTVCAAATAAMATTVAAAAAAAGGGAFRNFETLTKSRAR